MLPKILARFNRAGGWIFSDGSNSRHGKGFQRLLCADWHEKPSYGFRFRKVDDFSLLNRRGMRVYAIEVSPLPDKPQVMRAGWVPPRDKNTEKFNFIWDYCTSNNRLVPMPPQWNELYDLLKNTRQMPSDGWEPPLPLMLAAWHHSTPIEKQLRFKEHLQWAQTQGQLEDIGAFLRSLPESQWCHFDEI